MKKSKLLSTYLAIGLISLSSLSLFTTLTTLTSCDNPETIPATLTIATIDDVKKNAYETVNVVPELKYGEKILDQDTKPEDALLEFDLVYPEGSEINSLPLGLNFSPLTGAINGSVQQDVQEFELKIVATYTPEGETTQTVSTNFFSIEIDALSFAHELPNLTCQYKTAIFPSNPISMLFREVALPAGEHATFSFYNNANPSANPTDISSLPGLTINQNNGVISGVLSLELPSTQLPNPTACAIKAQWTHEGHNYVTISNPFTISVVANNYAVLSFAQPVQDIHVKTSDEVFVQMPAFGLMLNDELVNAEAVTYTCTFIPSLPSGLEYIRDGQRIQGTPTMPYPETTYTYIVTTSGLYSASASLTFKIRIDASNFDASLNNNGGTVVDNKVATTVNGASINVTPVGVLNSNPLTKEVLTMTIDPSSSTLPVGVQFANNSISGTPNQTVRSLVQDYVLLLKVAYVHNGVTFTENLVLTIEVRNSGLITYQNINGRAGSSYNQGISSFDFNGQGSEPTSNHGFQFTWVDAMNSNTVVTHSEIINAGSAQAVQGTFVLQFATPCQTTWYLKIIIRDITNTVDLLELWTFFTITITDV